MVFLIEGIDGCGKTTVVENLKKSIPEITYVKESFPGDSLEERQRRLKILRHHINSCETVVYDRATALDEFIYNPIIAKKAPILSWDEVKPLLSQCVIIYLRCAASIAGSRLESRGDEYIGADLLKGIAETYSGFLDRLPNVHIIDVTDMSEQEEYEAVIDAMISSMNLHTKKRPKLAHIVPRELLHLTAGNQYHMSLAHLIKGDVEYLNFYRKMVAAGRYVLMDNGAAENSQLSMDDLFECWKALRPTELVLPDTLCNKDETLSKTRTAIQYFRDKGVDSKFMAVPQGRDFWEWKDCAREFIRMPDIHCLGVSKFLTIQLKDPDVRYRAVAEIVRMKRIFGRGDIEIHLLGCDAGPSEPAKIFKDFGFDVRGCDTALAYIFAQSGEVLEADSKRPEGEMSFLDNTLSSVDTLLDAVKRFNNIAGVVNNFGDYTWF